MNNKEERAYAFHLGLVHSPTLEVYIMREDKMNTMQCFHSDNVHRRIAECTAVLLKNHNIREIYSVLDTRSVPFLCQDSMRSIITEEEKRAFLIAGFSVKCMPRFS